MDDPVSRIVLVALLVTLLGAQLLWFGAYERPTSGELSPGVLDERYASYIGQRVAITAPVVATDPVVLALDGGADARLTVRGVDSQPAVGDRLKVYGIVRPDREMRAIDAVVVRRWGLWYTYTVSFLAGLWVLLRFVRYWKFDARTFALERRERPLWTNDA